MNNEEFEELRKELESRHKELVMTIIQLVTATGSAINETSLETEKLLKIAIKQSTETKQILTVALIVLSMIIALRLIL